MRAFSATEGQAARGAVTPPTVTPVKLQVSEQLLTPPQRAQVEAETSHSHIAAAQKTNEWLPDTLSGWITMGVAVLGLLLGAYNAWYSRWKDSTRIAVSLVKKDPTAPKYTHWLVKAINESQHPIFVEKVMLITRDGKTHKLPHGVERFGDAGAKPQLPLKLNQGELMEYPVNNSFLDNHTSLDFVQAMIITANSKKFKSQKNVDRHQRQLPSSSHARIRIRKATAVDKWSLCDDLTA
jgi:hypothetical protein